MNYDKLFITLNNLFGVDALESEMHEIKNAVPYKEFTEQDISIIKAALKYAIEYAPYTTIYTKLLNKINNLK